MSLALIVLLPWVGALLVLCAGASRNRCALIAASAPLAALLLVFAHLPALLSAPANLSSSNATLVDAALRASWSWLPQQGLQLTLWLDGLALLFVLLILGIGLLVILYARYYLSARDSLSRLYALLLMFMGSMLGVVTSANLLLLVVFWELTSLTSFLLIGYWSQQRAARRGARMALTITGAGGLCLLAGLLLLGQIAGSYDLSAVLDARVAIQQHPFYPCALLLIVVGALSKSAQFPFHFWLPQAMAAPTPVSAYLHSATMVKLGVFVLARFYPVLSGSDWWFYLVAGSGLITLSLGAYQALLQHDLKGLLAYSTISHIGLIVLLLGIATPLAVVAALFHLINHAIFKASLFMAAGVIDHETGTRDMRRLKGLWRYMPHTAALAMVAAAAMAGVPLLNGFLSKEMFFAETLALRHSAATFAAPLLATLAGIFAVAYSLRFIHDVFFNGNTADLPKYPPHEPPRYMKLPIEILVVLCVLVGIFPQFTVARLLRAAGSAVLDSDMPTYDLMLWHGFNLPLLMSAVALFGGVILYVLRKPLFDFHGGFRDWDALQIFEVAVQKVIALCRFAVRQLERDSLRYYLMWVIGSVAIAVAVALMEMPRLSGALRATAIDAAAALYLAIAIAAALLTAYWQRRRLRAIIAMGVVGLMSALIFARFSAPDLALTQLAVEVVSTLLLLLALNFLPQKTDREPRKSRHWRDLLLAIAAGGAVAALAYAVMTRPYDSIAQYFIDQSLPGGGGHNVVNLILVDFRGFDTLGEITVLLIAAAAIAALLSGLTLSRSPPFAKRGDSAADRLVESRAAQRAAAVDGNLQLTVALRLLLPLILLFAVYLLLRGHNAPGGGFVAGLITALALLSPHLAVQRGWLALPTRSFYLRIAAGGVALALSTGLASWLFGAPFLTSTFAHWPVPWLGEIEIASAMLFDLGVYAAVLGATLTILSRLGALANDRAAVPANTSEKA